MDLIIRNARLPHDPLASPVDIGVQDGKIVAMAASLPGEGPAYDAEGHLVCAGLVETHIHLDKTRIIDRCPPEDGRNANAVPRVAAVKATFTEADVYHRASITLENCIKHGTTRMRTHVDWTPVSRCGVSMRWRNCGATTPGRSTSSCVCSRRRADQQQTLRRIAGAGIGTGGSGDWRGANYDPDKNGRSTGFLIWLGNMMPISTCIWIPATALMTWISIWCAS